MAALRLLFGKVRQHNEEVELVQMKEFGPFGAASVENESLGGETCIQFLNFFNQATDVTTNGELETAPNAMTMDA